MLKIIHFSDIHLSTPPGSASAFFDKRLIGYLNGAIIRKYAYRQERLIKAVPMILKEKPDVIVFTGDATTCSQPEEFEKALNILKPLIDSGIPILFTPGNHDCYVRNKQCVEALREFRVELTGSENAPAKFETPECDFLIFHSAVPTSPVLSCGYFSGESLEFLKKECAAKHKPLIALTHFPFIRTEKGIAGARRKLYGAESARNSAVSGEIDLVLCGHIHTPYEILDSSGRGELCAGSLTKKGIFRKITYTDNMFRIENIYTNN